MRQVLCHIHRVPDQIRMRLTAYGVCRMDLHVIDGDSPNLKLPMIMSLGMT